MRSIFLVIALGACILSNQNAVQGDDPIRKSLDKAILKFESSMSGIQKRVMDELDKQNKDARAARVINEVLIRTIVAEQEAFVDRGQMPTIISDKIQRELSKSQKTLTKAFEKARDDYLRDKKDAAAEELKKELKQILKQSPPEELNATQLFDGASLNGWEARNGNLAYSVLAGQLVCSTPGIQGSLQNKKSLSNFSLKLEYKFPREGLGNLDRTGIMLSVVAGHNGNYVAGQTARGAIEYQLKPGESGNLCILAGKGNDNPKTLRKVEAERPVGLWNDLEIRFEGNNLDFYLNNQLVNHVQIDQPRDCNVALRNGCAVAFRHIRVISPPPAKAQ
jgi:Domain of Unknown Function (DUF1080)